MISLIRMMAFSGRDRDVLADGVKLQPCENRKGLKIAF